MAIKINGKDLQKRIINGKEVEKVMLNGVQIWPEATPPVTDDYLCFTAVEPNSEIRLFKSLNPASVTLEISTDGANWNTYTIGSTITLHNIGDKVYRRNSSETDTLFSTSTYDYYRFSMTGAISGSGNVTYLLNKNGTDTLSAFCFHNLFQGCAALITAPGLPITTTATCCCWAMFHGCSSLTTLPILPATTLESMCYREMFFSCSNIKLSETRVGEYQTEYRIPASGTGIDQRNALMYMFGRTGGTFTGIPNINQTYYTSNQVITYISPGIYHNATLGLISLSSDGRNWTTIADKNLGATGLIIYDSFGLYYQWGNNHGWPFPMDWNYPVGPGLQDVNGYGPGNYYSDTHFRSLGDGGWYVTPNSDLWGGVTNTDASKQGPCPSGYHIPTIQELDNIIAVGELMGAWDRVSNVPPIVTYLKLSGDAGHTPRNEGITQMGAVWIWGCTDGTGQTASSLFIDGGTLVLGYTSKADCNTIRPFKNDPVIPDSTWDIVYQPS